jgi:branched-chain amino acid transport system substrate-binding protein
MKTHNHFRRLIISGLLLTGFTFSAFSQSQTLKIGLIGPMTGAAATWGYAAKGSMQTLADEVNAKGGLEVSGKKYQIQIVAYDDQYKAAEAIAAYQRLVTRDGVKHIIVQTSAPTMAIKQLVEDDKIVTLTTAYSPAAIDDKTKFMFRAYSTAVDFMPPYAAWMKNNLKERRMVTLNPNDETGWSQAKTTEKLYKENGFDVLSSELYERTTKDFVPMLTKALALKPDVIDLGASSPGSAGLIVRQAREAGFKGRFVQTGGAGWLEVVATAGKAASEGMINMLYADQNNPGFQRVAADYKRQYNGQTPNEMIAVYYDAMSVLLAAIKKGGDINDTAKTAASFSSVLPMSGLQGDEMTYSYQQIRTYDYVGMLKDGVPVVVGKVK